MEDSLTLHDLQEVLGPRPVRFFERVASTQDEARDWALAPTPAPAGAVVVAEEQTAGRGRQGRHWHSPPGSSLMFSVVLRPALAPERLAHVTMAAGLALADTLSPSLGTAFALKWPNDGVVRGRKLCGILTEAVWLGERLEAVIVGVGLNVRTDFTGTGLEAVATSLEAEAGQPFDRRQLLATLLGRLDHWAAQAGSVALVDAWRGRLGTLGQRVTVYAGPAGEQEPPFVGVAEDVDEEGALLVRLEDGELRRVLAGDVALDESGLV